MHSDTDALAAYAEAWKPGDPLPAGMEIEHGDFDGKTYTFVRWRGCKLTTQQWSDPDRRAWDILLRDSMSEALTGVLVVELARRWHLLYSVSEGQSWRVASESGNRVGAGPTPLCALVAAWLGVNK